MKVGILTFHFAANYGAVYQALGLQTALLELGHDVTFIDYVPKYMDKRPKSLLHGWGVSKGKNIYHGIQRRINNVQRQKQFNAFVNKHLNLSKTLKLESEVAEYCENIDAVIVGSDQVWNMSWMKKFEGFYFLDFLRNNTKIKKIAYGACFGQATPNREYLDKALLMIREFDRIGMRNNFGIKILSESSTILSERIVDPAFFLPPSTIDREKKGITIYAVHKEGASICTKVAEGISELTGESISAMGSEINIEYPDNIKVLSKLSPEKWLNQLIHSSFVCSESFHGTVFSLLNGIPFIAASEGERSHRVDDLLNHYGHKGRKISYNTEFNKELAELNKEYYTKLQSDIESSKEFLRKALEG